MSFKRYSLCVDDGSYRKIENIVKTTGRSRAEVTRELIQKGLAAEWVDENVDMITKIISQRVDAVMKTHVERICKLSSKSGHMAATAAFLNVQALMDLVPKENRRDVRPMYDNARKKAVAYMRTRTEDWEE